MKSMLTVFLSLSLGCSAPQASLGTITSAQASDWPKTYCSLAAVTQPLPNCGPFLAPACDVTCEAGSTHAVCAPAGSASSGCFNTCQCKS